MMNQVVRVIKGDVDPYTTKKWLHRLLSLLIVLIWLVPFPALLDFFDRNNTEYIVFFGVWLMIALALVIWVLQLWRRYEKVLPLWQKPSILIAVFALTWGLIGFYAIVLARRPLDFMFIFYLEACLLSLASALAIPQPYLSKSVAFFVLFWLLFAFIQTTFALREPFAFDFYNVPSSTLKVVFIGNSHIWNGVDSAIVDDNLGIHSSVLAYDGLDVSGAFYAVKQALQTQHPEIFVLEAYTLRQNSVDLGDYKYELISHYGLRGTLFYESIPDLFPPSSYWDALFPLIYYHSQWIQVSNGSFLRETAKNFAYTTYGMFPAKVQHFLASQRQDVTRAIIDSQTIASASHLPYPIGSDSTDTVSARNVEFLKRLQDLCAQNNARLMVVDIPTMPVTLGETHSDTPTAKIVAENNIPYFNYNTLYGEEYSRVDFWDFGHTNEFGATITSLHMAELLSEQLGIPIDEIIMAEYRNTLVKELLVSKEENQITYTLKMVESDLADVEFTWHVTDRSGIVLADAPYSDQNSVTFTLPDTDDYTITMGVRDRSHPEIHAEGILTEHYGQ